MQQLWCTKRGGAKLSWQRAEGKWSEVGGQRSEVRRQRAARGQRSEVGNQRSEDKRRRAARGQRSEVGGQRSEGSGQGAVGSVLLFSHMVAYGFVHLLLEILNIQNSLDSLVSILYAWN